MKADLHVHSQHSDDGRQTVEEILMRCEELGIGAVAITDHNVLKAPQDAANLRGRKVIVIPAMEITAEKGHVLAMGIRESVPSGLGVEETIRMIHQAGGIAVAPHAFRWWSGLGETNVRGKAFDAIEVINGKSKDRANRRARRLAEQLGLPGVGGSDAHDIPAIGRAYTEVPDGCQDPAAIVQAIREKRCEAKGAGRSRWTLGVGLNGIYRFFRRGFRRL